jgi:hypothetical protein
MIRIRISLSVLLISALLCLAAGCASSNSPITSSGLSDTSLTDVPTPTASTTSLTAPTPTGDKAALLAEIVRIRAGLKDGTLVADWSPNQRDFPSDFQVFLDGLEQAVYEPDVTVYLKYSAGAATALYAELAAMPEVALVVYVNREERIAELKEQYKDDPDMLALLERSTQTLATTQAPDTTLGSVTTQTPGTTLPPDVFAGLFKVWLVDCRQSWEFAQTMWDRPEVERANIGLVHSPDWVTLLERVVHEK